MSTTVGSGVVACVVGVACATIGQGAVRSIRARSANDSQRQSVKSASQARRDQNDKEIRMIAGWGFTVGGGAFFVIGSIILLRALLHVVS